MSSIAAPTNTPAAPATTPVTTPATTPAVPPVNRLANALAAAKAASKPEPSSGAPAAPPPPPAPAAAAPATPPVAETPPAPPATSAEPTPAQISWDMVKAGEKRVLAERQALKAEREALQRERSTTPPAATGNIPAPGQGDPLPALYAQGWTPDTLARHLLDAVKKGGPAASAAAPAVPAHAAVPQPVEREDNDLEARIARIEGRYITQSVESVLAASRFDVLRAEPDAVEQVLNRAERLYELSGELTIEKAAAIVQDELIARMKARLGVPAWKSAIGLTEAPPPSVQAPAASAPLAALDSITNNMAVSAPPVERPLTAFERRERARQAAQAAVARV